MSDDRRELEDLFASLTEREAAYTLLFMRALKRKRQDLCDYLWRRTARRAA